MTKMVIGLLVLCFLLLLYVQDIFSQQFKMAKMLAPQIASHSPVTDKKNQIEKLSSCLDQLYDLFLQKKDYREYAEQANLILIDGSVIVTIFPLPGQITEVIDHKGLEQANAHIQAIAKHSMRVAIPIHQLEKVATRVAGIGRIQRLVQPEPEAIISEGVGLMNADEWQAQGYQGADVKAAVIDGGFYKLTEAKNNGDIPQTYYSQDYTGSGMEASGDGEHGTAVAEAVYDIAPQASYYLYKINDVTHLENAKDDCIAQGVHIINHSMSWFNLSYYDGTGPVSDIANDAVANGIVWVNAAGNRAKDHYRSIFTATPDGYHDFTGSSGKLNALGPEPGYMWLFPIGTLVRGYLNWDSYPVTDQDYDLYLYKWNKSTSQWDQVASSTKRQSGETEPTESIVYLNRESEARYAFAVHKYSATTDVDFRLIGIYGLSIHIPASSILDPASAADVITVGAISMNFYENGPQEDFSSQGPTTDGRSKPEVTAPDSCNSFAYGHWQGTSLAAPYTAGVCALIKSRFPGFAVDDIKNYLYTNCTVDLGAPGRDNIYGFGKVIMPGFGETITITSPNGGESWYVGSTYDITWNSEETSGTVNIDYSIDNGSNWKSIVAGTADDELYAWTIPDDPSTTCLVRVTDTDGSPSDVSDAVFLMVKPIYPISGTVYYDGTTRLVSDAVIDLTYAEGTSQTVTDNAGTYLFENIAPGSVQLVPSNTNDEREAISGSDALLVLQYLAFLAELNEHQLFAADVTEDGAVSGSDAQAILRYLAFYTDNIGATGQWRFIPPDSSFTLETAAIANFNAYLKGDANLNWGEGSGLAKSNVSNIIIRFSDAIRVTENEIRVSLKIDTQGQRFHTLVATIDYDPVALNYKTTESPLSQQGFMLVSNGNEPGEVHIAMAGAAGMIGTGDVVMLIFDKVGQPQSTDWQVSRLLVNDESAAQPTRVQLEFFRSNLVAIPEQFYLEQNYPNPFNPETRITYHLPEASSVALKIFNLRGDEICTLVNSNMAAGIHHSVWNGKDDRGSEVVSGVYLMKLQAGDFQVNRKMIKLR